MFHMFVLFCLCCWSLTGVFGAETNEIQSVSVMEGDSVTLKTNVTELHGDDDIAWTYGAEKSLIVKISNEKQIFSTYDVPRDRFRDRLKVDHQTGSLTIMNITTQHAGVYEQQRRGAKLSSKTFNVSVYESDSLTVLISVAAAESLLIVAGFGIFCICWKCRKTDQEVQICEDEITHVVMIHEPTFYERNAHTLFQKKPFYC
uniref:Immunoglobulin domain-containing protein n=1 Tax=Cyprinus carpio TaxID=7962 RepID=A0A8C2D3E2_CYPCA